MQRMKTLSQAVRIYCTLIIILYVLYIISMFANPELNNDTSLIHLLLLCICYCVCYTVILQVRLQEILVQAQYLAVSIATTSNLSVN